MFQYAKDLRSPAVQAEISRQIRQHFYEWHDSVIRLRSGLAIGSEWGCWAPDDLGWLYKHNIVPLSGRNYVLDILLKNGTRAAALYCGVYGNNVAPDANWTASTFVTTGGEHDADDLDEAARVTPTWGTIAAGSVDNTASRIQFTSDVTSLVIWGTGLLTDQTFGSTAGTLVTATKFSSARTLPAVDDQLFLTATFTAASA